MSDFDRILNAIAGRKGQKTIVAIDGRCGSGKTTLADKIAGIVDAEIIHMDDFFLPAELRSAGRLGEAGGNIHYERFLDEVVAGIRSGEEFKYRKFSCKDMDYAGVAVVKNKPVIIVEGAYSLHPLYDHIYDIRIFCDIDGDEQKRRIIAREGAERYPQFRDKWIPMEELYISKYRIAQKCDFRIYP